MNDEKFNPNPDPVHTGELENQLRQIQPFMPESLQLREREIQFELGYQAGKASARKWQFSVWILALVTITSWMAPRILNQQKTSDLTKENSVEQIKASFDNKILAENQNVHDSDLNRKSETDNDTVSETSQTKATSHRSTVSPSAFNLFALMRQLNPTEDSHSTGAYSEYRERAMIIGTDALPEFKMASNNTKKKDSDSEEDPNDYTIFKKVKWSSILF